MKPASGKLLVEGLRLVAQSGAGGMGSVWSAQDERLDRLVAVKFIGAGALSADALARFRREATVAAKLKSPHVVPIFSHASPRTPCPSS